MYRTLYPLFKPIVSSKATGVMNVIHYSNIPGRIYFSSGAVISVKTNERKGTEAAEEIFSWISFFAQFKEKKLKMAATSKHVELTKKVMAHLARIEGQILQIKKNIKGCEAVFGFNHSMFNGGDGYTQEEKDIVSHIDGIKSVLEIWINSALSELDVLLIISHFVDRGLAYLLRAHEPLSVDEKRRFFKILTETLSEITGPVAEIIVDEVCAAMGKAREDFCKSDLGPLFNYICTGLEKEEQEALNAKSIIEQAFQ